MLAALDKEVNATLGVIQGVLSDAKSISETLKSGQGTIGALLTDREMYDDIREMMKDLKRHPWKFIWKE
jgi:phospholipid/cholesterol/gamma-HCH transport system substrate-binding protein